MQNLSMHQTQHLLVTEPAWLTALGGKLWVTRRGDPADYILAPGERLALSRGDDVTVGGWESMHPALWDWQPAVPARRYRLLREVVAAVFGLAARGLRAGAEALAALARNAAAIACRAQGCIRAGDSMASAGTVQ
jgi:Protein of unknown function (DUF2917)